MKKYCYHHHFTGKETKAQTLICLRSGASGLPSVVKNLPTVQERQETWVQFLGEEDPLEEGMATHSGILTWRIYGQRAWWATVHGVAKSQTQLSMHPGTSASQLHSYEYEL